MPPSPGTAKDEIVRLYKAGGLSAELARYHERTEGEDEPFIQLCIELHNSGDIDLLSVPGQPAFAEISLNAFFTAQHLYCEAIPKLNASVAALMECCRILVERGGTDGAATQPYIAFRIWCQNNPNESATVIGQAREGDGLAKQFVTFALQAVDDIELAISFVRSYDDDRRLSGMRALANMTIADIAEAQKAIAALEPFVGDSSDDNARLNALLAAFDVLKKHNDAGAAKRLIEAAVEEPGPGTLYGLAQILWLHHVLLDLQALRTALLALEAVDPGHPGTIRTVDQALKHLLGTPGEELALDFLTERLQDGKFTLKNFEMTGSKLQRGDSQRLYGLIVRWLISGNIALCSNVSELVGIDEKRAFDATVEPLGLTSNQQIFLCRKAIGFLFWRPVICCSIIVSVLRGGDQNIGGAAIELLFDPLLLNYGGSVKEYLDRIAADDPAYTAVQIALTRINDYYVQLDKVPTIKELHPSDYQRDVVRQRTRDEMRKVQKSAESQSVLMQFVHRSTILYGKNSLTFVTDGNGRQHAVAMELKPFGVSIELPRRDILDPIGLEYMLRVYQACAFRGRRPLIPTHGDHLFRSMTTNVARVRKSTVGCVC